MVNAIQALGNSSVFSEPQSLDELIQEKLYYNEIGVYIILKDSVPHYIGSGYIFRRLNDHKKRFGGLSYVYVIFGSRGDGWSKSYSEFVEKSLIEKYSETIVNAVKYEYKEYVHSPRVLIDQTEKIKKVFSSGDKVLICCSQWMSDRFPHLFPKETSFRDYKSKNGGDDFILSNAPAEFKYTKIKKCGRQGSQSILVLFHEDVDIDNSLKEMHFSDYKITH